MFQNIFVTFFSTYMTCDIDHFLEKAYNKELLSEHQIKIITNLCKEILITESNVHRVKAPQTLASAFYLIAGFIF